MPARRASRQTSQRVLTRAPPAGRLAPLLPPVHPRRHSTATRETLRQTTIFRARRTRPTLVRTDRVVGAVPFLYRRSPQERRRGTTDDDGRSPVDAAMLRVAIAEFAQDAATGLLPGTRHHTDHITGLAANRTAVRTRTAFDADAGTARTHAPIVLPAECGRSLDRLADRLRRRSTADGGIASIAHAACPRRGSSISP
jgi:hypothetical protein